MINISKYNNNNFVLYLNQDVSLTNPYFIFEFVANTNAKTVLSLTDESNETSYNEFNFWETSMGVLPASGDLNIYESAVDTSVVTDLTKIYSTMYKLVLPTRQAVFFDPSIQQTDTAWDPSSNDNRINVSTFFDPVWVSGPLNPFGIPASNILDVKVPLL